MSPLIRTRIIWAAIVLAIVAAAVFAFAPRPQRVDSGLVTVAAMRVALEAEGKTRVRDRYVVDAPVAGNLGRVVLREGDRVAAGALVAVIDPVPFRASIDEQLAHIAESRAQRAGIPAQAPKPAALSQAQDKIRSAQSRARAADARVVQALAAEAQARRDLARAAALAATGDVARDQLEASQLAERLRERDVAAAIFDARAAHADVAGDEAALAELQARRSDADYLYGVYAAQIGAAQASLRRVRHDAEQADVRAPVAGKVLRVLQQSAAAVTAGTPILELGNVRALEMVIDVLSSDAVGIVPGAPVRVVSGAERVLRGGVRRVEASAFTKVSALGIEEQRTNVIADFLDPPGRLGDLYHVETEIDLWSSPSVAQVPIGALFRCAERWCAYVIADGRARRRSLNVGHINDDAAEVRGGLSRGERVILQPGDDIEDGARVTAGR
jgi:HlyD family secretion protein